MPQALPKLIKLHNFITMCQLKGIARCRKGKGMMYLKKRNTESLLQKKEKDCPEMDPLPLPPALPL